MEKTGQDLNLRGDYIMVVVPESGYEELKAMNDETEALNVSDPDVVPRVLTSKEEFELKYVQTTNPVVVVNLGKDYRDDITKGDTVYLRAFVAVSKIELNDVSYFVIRPADILATV